MCPSLIVLLISSLVYFVVLAIYRGEYSGRIGYIWFMFIVGAVGIARLSIQESRKYAVGYAAVLALATWIVLSRFITIAGPLAGLTPLINGALIALVWYLADRITFDCTLIDDDHDASGQGLLDTVLDGTSPSEPRHSSTPRHQNPLPEAPANGLASESVIREKSGRSKGARQPGRTVLWLTAAALPIFGLGQAMLPSGDRWQQSAIFALSVYLFAALSLLVATSFLGVRRYLRQRGVAMPTNVSAAWLVGGIAVTFFLLTISLTLPLPGRWLARWEPSGSIRSPEWLQPSRYGWGDEQATEDPLADSADRPSGTPSQDSSSAEPDPSNDRSNQSPGGSMADQAETSGGSSGRGEQSGGEQSGGEQSGGEQSGGEQSGGEQSGGEQSGGEQSGGEQSGGEQPGTEGDSSNQSDAESSESASAEDGPAGEQASQSSERDRGSSGQRPSPPSIPLSSFIRGLVYLTLIAFLLAVAWIYRNEWLGWLRQWFQVREEGSRQEGSGLAQTHQQRPPRSFASFRQPAWDGSDGRGAVLITFEAAEAWWRERGYPRREDETPTEYFVRLRSTVGDQVGPLAELIDSFNRVGYGGGKASSADLSAAKRLWRWLARSSTTLPPAMAETIEVDRGSPVGS